MTTKTSKHATNAAEAVSAIIAAPPIPLANPKPLEPWEQEADAPLNPTFRPSADWTLDQLGRFAAYAARKTAEAAWELGRALKLAKKKLAGTRKWTEWANKWVPHLKERTRQRYMAVGELDYDDVKGKTLDDVYRLLFGEDYAGGDAGPTTNATTPTETPPTTTTDETKAEAGDSATPPTGETNEAKTKKPPIPDKRANALKYALDIFYDLMTNPEEWKDTFDTYRGDLTTLATDLTEFLADSYREDVAKANPDSADEGKPSADEGKPSADATKE